MLSERPALDELLSYNYGGDSPGVDGIKGECLPFSFEGRQVEVNLSTQVL